MAYQEEYKKEILEQMKTKTIKEIAKETGISPATLYNWKKKHEMSEEAFERVKIYRKSGSKADIERAEELAKRFSDNGKIQSQLMKIYMQSGSEADREKAEEIAKKFSDNEIIQSQLMTIYMKSRSEEDKQKARKIAENHPNCEPIQSQLMKIYRKSRTKTDREKAEKIAKKFSDDEIIQSQLMTIYMKSGSEEDRDKAIEIAENHPNCEPIQSQLMTIYMKSGSEEDRDKAIEIAENHPNYEPIQSQLMTIYMKSGSEEDREKAIEIAKRFPNYKVMQSQLRIIEKQVYLTKNRLKANKKDESMDKNLLEEQKGQINNMFTRQSKQKKGNILTGIRAKIYVGTIENADIQELEAMMQNLEKSQYYFIKIAAYEKLGQKNNALRVIKQMETEGITPKQINAIKDRLKSKKQTIFDLDKWDGLIGWDVTRTEQYEEEERKKQQANRQQEEKANIKEPNNEKQEKVEQTTQEKKEKKEEKATQKPKSIITNIGSIAKKNGRKEEPKEKIKKEKSKVETQKDTISSTMSESLKKVINEINCKYYVEMQPRAVQTGYEERARQEKYIKKYDKLESILACDAKKKRAQIELMLVLINEGYRDVAKREFPKEDYEFIEETIKQYYAKTIKPQEAKKKIDEYCIG